MARSLWQIVRSIALSLILVLALQALNPHSAAASASSITLSPTAAPVGTTVTVSGSGFGAFENVNLYFAGNYQKTVATNNGAFVTTITVPNVPVNTYSIAVVGSTIASASFQVTAAPTVLSSLTIVKSVTVNGLGYSTNNVARNGDTLTYNFVVTNTSPSVTATGVYLTDNMQLGQTAFNAAGASCGFVQGSSTVNCALGNIAPGASVSVFVSARVNATFAGTITNLATVQGTNTAPATSNPTYVTVNQVAPSPFPASNLTLCGTVTNYVAATVTLAGTVTVNGTTVALINGSSVTGVLAVSTSVCVSFQFNSVFQATSMSVSSNLAGVGLVCGAYNPAAATSSIYIAGQAFSVTPGTVLNGYAFAGQPYCFLVSSTGSVYGLLSTVPTSIKFLPSYGMHRVGLVRYE